MLIIYNKLQVFAGKGRLRIGYYTEDDYLSPAPAMKEGVLLAVKALEEAGHEVAVVCIFYCSLQC